jgi:LCP family protein required for cell wall assembly
MSKQPLNTVFAHAGLSCVAKTVGELTGFPVGFAAKLSFDGVIGMTNAIGGVDICVAEPGLSDEHTGLNLPAGMHTVQGVEALQFLRTRHGVGDESDLARISNQQQYMSRLAKKILSADVLGDPATVLRLANTVAENIVPSAELANPLRLGQLALAIRDVPFSDFVFVQFPTVTDPDDPDRVVADEDAAAALFAALAANQPLELTGGVSPNEGVEEVTPSAEPAPEPTSTPDEERAVLPSEITGVTVEQETCSAGNLR